MSPFHFHLTAKLARTLKCKQEPAPAPENLHWLDNWYVRDIPLDGLIFDALLFTNPTTCYSLLHPFDHRESTEEIIHVFGQRLAFHTGQPLPYSLPVFRLCKTASRRVLGCMNELQFMTLHMVENQLQEDGVRLEKIEERLNEAPIGGLFPCDEFQKHLNGVV